MKKRNENQGKKIEKERGKKLNEMKTKGNENKMKNEIVKTE